MANSDHLSKSDLPDQVRTNHLAASAHTSALVRTLEQAGVINPRHFHANLVSAAQELVRSGESDAAQAVFDFAVNFDREG